MTPILYHANAFPPKTMEWERLLPLIGPANAAVALYEGVLLAVPNPTVLLSPLTSQEAVLSSRIEGTQATLGEVLEFEAQSGRLEETSEKYKDIQEVINYRQALKEATRLLNTLPLSQRLFKATHEVLLQGVRGRHKSPGEYRKIANWIGPAGCTQEESRFVPCGADRLVQAMSDWERYAHGDDVPDKLIQLAVLHAEFEAIHPFLDGNGRLGRLMVPLFLKEKGLLTQPNFYISAYFERNREEYYDRLLRVSSHGDWTGWCEFFLKAIISQAHENKTKALAMVDLYQVMKGKMIEMTRSQYAIPALDWLFDKPIFTTPDMIALSGIPQNTAKRIMRLAREEGIIKELSANSGAKAAVFVFADLLNIAEGHTIF